MIKSKPVIESNIDNIKKRNKKVLIFGNGAGQSIADHFSVDITKNAKIKSLTFSSDNHLTCYANDYGYENLFKRQLEAIGQEGDIFMAYSTSGMSKNIITIHYS